MAPNAKFPVLEWIVLLRLLTLLCVFVEKPRPIHDLHPNNMQLNRFLDLSLGDVNDRPMFALEDIEA